MRVTVNMATFPPRRLGLGRRIKELAPQCDLMRIYLNGYSEWPSDILKPDNVEYVLGSSPETPDLGSQGKLHWLSLDEDVYYLTVDDDIVYPPDYVSTLVKGCSRYGDLCIVGFHGQRFSIGDNREAPVAKEARGARRMFRYNSFLYQDTSAHMLGNGLMCCRPKVLGLTRACITGPKNSGDDEDMAVFAQINKVPMVTLAHRSRWITADKDLCQVEASYLNPEFLRLQNEKLQTCRRWRLYDRPKPLF